MFDNSINSRYLLSDTKHASLYKTCCFISFEHFVSDWEMFYESRNVE
jgi:hypothetical protein